MRTLHVLNFFFFSLSPILLLSADICCDTVWFHLCPVSRECLPCAYALRAVAFFMPVHVVALVREIGRALPERTIGRAFHRGEVIWGHGLDTYAHTHTQTYTSTCTQMHASNTHVR